MLYLYDGPIPAHSECDPYPHAERANEDEDEASVFQAREALGTCLSILQDMSETSKIESSGIAVINRLGSHRESATTSPQVVSESDDGSDKNEANGTNISGAQNSPRGQSFTGEMLSSFATDLSNLNAMPLPGLNTTPFASSGDIASFLSFGLNDMEDESSEQNLFQTWQAASKLP
jgi:hypothetical protein